MDYPIRFSDQLKQHLRALRKAKGLTQTQLGELLGIGQVRVAEIEKDPSAISVAQLFKVLAALDVRLVLRDQHSDAVSVTPKSRW
jgi:HTH-type transcriptional regulator/antitoxin HipB